MLPIELDPHSFRLTYGDGVFAPEPEVRTLEAIRPSLLDPQATGPDEVYVIAMDVGLQADRATLEQHMLLLGVVGYAAGRIGEEPVRSQGHVHMPSPHSGWSPPEIFEIWAGSAIVYMQESVSDDPKTCYAIRAEKGDVIVCPPGWGHMVINADSKTEMVFGALCDRGYAGFDYEEVRNHRGLAYYPVLDEQGRLQWRRNPTYLERPLEERSPGTYWFHSELEGRSLYDASVQEPGLFSCVPHPERCAHVWEGFKP